MEEKDLSGCPICNGLTNLEKGGLLQGLHYKTVSYEKGATVARQGDRVNSLYLLIKGSVKTEMINEAGQLIGIDILHAPKPLASAFLFAERNRFPVDVTALEACEIIEIPREEVMRQLAINPAFMQSYLRYNANRTQFLTDKLQLMSIKTIRGKLSYYIISHLQSGTNEFQPEQNQTELAEFFGVARPSLARTIAEMEEEGLIIYERKRIIVPDVTKLQRLL